MLFCVFRGVFVFLDSTDQGRIQGGCDWGDRLPHTDENNFIHHDFAQNGKQYSRYKVILPSIVLSQQFSLLMHPDQAQNTSSGIQEQEATAVAVIYVTAPQYCEVYFISRTVVNP